MKGSRLILFAMVVALAGCSRAPHVTITNRSTNVLANVVVTGSGFTNRIDSIAVGAETKFTVHPRGDSGIRITFDAAGQHIDSGDNGYFEGSGGYMVAVTVEPNLKVLVSSKLRNY